MTRINLRLPEQLKAGVEQAASRERLSVNAWLVRAVAADVAERARRARNPMGAFRPDRDRPQDSILDELRAVNALLEQKATPEEAEAFRDWLRATAQATALAAKEGGFLGFGGERVSDDEQQMLERLGAVFGQPG